MYPKSRELVLIKPDNFNLNQLLERKRGVSLKLKRVNFSPYSESLKNSIPLVEAQISSKPSQNNTLRSLWDSMSEALRYSPVHPNPVQPLHSPLLRSGNYQSFILKNVGLFLTYQNNLLGQNKNLPKSQVKKKLFSFLYPEQEKRNLFLRKKKSTLSSLVRNVSRSAHVRNFFSFKSILQLYLQKSKVHHLNSGDFFPSSKSNFSHSSIDILDRDHHKTKGTDSRYYHTVRDVKLDRVRFKPGYQRL